MLRYSFIILFFFFIITTLSCSREFPNAVDTDSRVVFNVRIMNNIQSISGMGPLLKPMVITRVSVTVQGSGMTTISKDLEQSGDTFTGTLDVPKGKSRNFQISALDANNIVQYDGSAVRDIEKDRETVDISVSAIYPDPVTLEITSMSAVSISLSWGQSQADDFSFYRITRSTSSTPHDVNADMYIDIDSRGATTFVDSGLTPNTTYYYTVWVVDSEGFAWGSNTENRHTPSYLFKAIFTQDWLCPDCGEGIIFISGMDGTLLAEASWSGNATVTLEPPANMTTLPEVISVTTVCDLGYGIEISTDLNVATGSTWTLKGIPLYPSDEPVGSVTLNFTNVPGYSGYLVSSPWNYDSFSSGTIESPLVYDIYKSPVNLYIKLYTFAGPQFMWLNNVTPASYTVNCNNLADLNTVVVEYPEATTGINAFLYGFSTAGDHYGGSYCLDRQFLRDSLTQTIQLTYPAHPMTDFFTSLYDWDFQSSDFYWNQTTWGDIPSVFIKPDADFDYISGSYDHFQIQAAGAFDQIMSEWYTFDVATDNDVWWDVYGPSDLTYYSLPVLPDQVSAKFANLSGSDFELNFVDLIDYSQLSTHREILDVLFNSPDYFYNVIHEERYFRRFYDQVLSKRAGQLTDKEIRKRRR